MLISKKKSVISTCQLYRHKGFTLIETVVGIVVLSLSFAIISTFLFPVANQSVEQVHQMRAAELGQSFLNEILGRAFDENSDMSGGLYRCGEDQDGSGIIESSETCSTVLGPESETRITFDDVDDYIANNLSGDTLLNSIEDPIGDVLYLGFNVNIEVCNDSNYDGLCEETDNNFTAKLIKIIVTTPQQYALTFSAYKANF